MERAWKIIRSVALGGALLAMVGISLPAQAATSGGQITIGLTILPKSYFRVEGSFVYFRTNSRESLTLLQGDKAIYQGQAFKEEVKLAFSPEDGHEFTLLNDF